MHSQPDASRVINLKILSHRSICNLCPVLFDRPGYLLFPLLPVTLQISKSINPGCRTSPQSAKMAPLSVSTAAAVNHGPTSLHLFKLSHCTTTTPRSNMLWTHLPNRDDMFAVFDQLRRKNPDGSIVEKKVMKLVRAGELLVSMPPLEYVEIG